MKRVCYATLALLLTLGSRALAAAPVIAVDSHGQQVGRYCGFGLLCQNTPVGWLSPSVIDAGIWAPHVTAFFTTSNCSDSGWVISDLNALVWTVNDIAIPLQGGTVIYPDRSKIQTITAAAMGLVMPDGSVQDCTTESTINGGPFTGPAAPLTEAPYQTFFPPFHLQ